MKTTHFPIDLLEAFDPHRGTGVVAFVGSGPSCQAGLPSWPELLRRIAAEVGLNEEVEVYLNNGQFLRVAEFLASQRSPKDIKERVARQIERTAQGPSTLHKLIVNLPFAGIITTNYDLLLTEADGSRHFKPPMTYLNSGLRSKLGERFILHLHGHVGDPETIIITRQGYDYIELKEERVRQFLAGVFQTRSVLFVGFGFVDSHIDDLLRHLKDTGAIGESTVFALIPSQLPTDRVLNDNLRVRSINPIYMADSGDYGVRELQTWLESLGRALNQIDRSQIESVRAVKPKYLIDKIEKLFAADDGLALLTEALRTLPDRPDLQHLLRVKLTPSDVKRILERLGVAEMRQVLIVINEAKHDPVVEDALTCFPPVRKVTEVEATQLRSE
jgi:hypothetical protein